MTGFHGIVLAIELIEAGIRRPHVIAAAARITNESASNLIDALDGERHGTMTELTGGWFFPRSADQKSLGQRLN